MLIFSENFAHVLNERSYLECKRALDNDPV